MANFISRLFGRLTGTSRPRAGFQADRRRARNGLRRQLRVECMESRRLLANDFGAVTGNIFTDLTDDGLDAGDTAIQGATVRLYSDDNTDGTLDAGDTLLFTTTSDANGDYLFPDLLAGQYIVEQVPVTGQVQRDAQRIQVATVTPAQNSGVSSLTVDALTTVTTPDPLVAAPNNTASDVQTGLVSEIMGLERDIVISNDAGSTSNMSLDIDPGGSMLIDAGVATTGEVFITYDGADADASTLAHLLGSIDLTANNGRALQFTVGSQVGSQMTLEVYSGDALTASSLTQAIPTTAGGAATATLNYSFDQFTQMAGATAAADFTNVTAIRIHLVLSAADDVSVDFVGVQALDPTTINMANLNPLTIGNLVFSDLNDNGVFDGADAGISGVSVELYQDTNANGTYDDGTDQAVAGGTATTDANGLYTFTDLLPGEYLVLVPISQFSGGNALEGYQTSSGNDPAPDPDDDANDDDNGALIAGIGVATQAITLASAGEPTNDGDADNNTNLSVDLGFMPIVDLQVTKTADLAQVAAGNQLTYTITVTNAGQATATNVLLVDDLPNLNPTNLSIVSATSAGGGTVTQTANANGEVEVSYASLAAGASDTVTIVVAIPASAAAAAAVTNTATVSSAENDIDTNNNTASVNAEIIRTAVLTLTKTDTPDPTSVGSALTYDIVVTNTGPSSATNVVVSDTLPTGFNFTGVTTTAGTASEAGGVITANIPSLDVGNSATIQVSGTIDATFTSTSIDNTATASADEATQVVANSSTTVNPVVDLSVTKADDVDPIDRGSTLVYTIDVSNAGPSAATNVQIVDTLPAGVTFVSATGGTVTAPSGGSTDATVVIGSIASGGSAQVTITVTVDANAPDTLSNSVTVSSTETTNGFDSNTANNTATQDTTVNPAIDLAVTKTDSTDPVIAGNSLVYTMVVTNNGPSTATNVTLTDTLPAGVTFTSATETQGTSAHNSGVVTFDVGTLASGGSATLTITVGVNPDATGTLSNSATATATETDTTTANNTATQDTTVNSSVDLEVTKTESATSVSPGDTLTYSIVVTNNGPSTATSVVMTDTLPSELSFASATSDVGTVTEANGVVTATIGTLAPGSSATVTLNTTVIATTAGTISNVASVTAAESESNTANNSATEATALQDLPLSKRRLLASFT